MRTGKVLQVLYKGDLVGTLAMTADRRIAFAYEDGWIRDGFSISPFSLPLRKQVFFPVKNYFQGLFGVFADSLPDAWGNLLLNRLLRKNGIDPGSRSALDRLAIVGGSGMGALTYEPEFGMETGQTGFNLDEIARRCAQVLKTEYGSPRSSSGRISRGEMAGETEENDRETDHAYLDELYRLGGTSGGARPKIMTEIDGKDWIIKFPAQADKPDAGRMEYDYSLCARECGIDMPQTRLFPSARCAGYFGAKRFDRTDDGGRIGPFARISAEGLAEASLDKDEEGEDKFLILVNKDHPLPDDYQVEVQQAPYGACSVSSEIYPALKEMLEAGRQEGLRFVVASGYRSSSYQQGLLDEDIRDFMNRGMSYDEAYEEATKDTMPAGCSEHSTGLAVDIVSASYQMLNDGLEKMPEIQWLQEHCAEYGFILRYPKGKEDITKIIYESWHFRYVGTEAAKEIMERGLTLEEYLAEQEMAREKRTAARQRQRLFEQRRRQVREAGEELCLELSEEMTELSGILPDFVKSLEAELKKYF